MSERIITALGILQNNQSLNEMVDDQLWPAKRGPKSGSVSESK
jgi:hypothetical protein